MPSMKRLKCHPQHRCLFNDGVRPTMGDQRLLSAPQSIGIKKAWHSGFHHLFPQAVVLSCAVSTLRKASRPWSTICHGNCLRCCMVSWLQVSLKCLLARIHPSWRWRALWPILRGCSLIVVWDILTVFTLLFRTQSPRLLECPIALSYHDKQPKLVKHRSPLLVESMSWWTIACFADMV